jgi:hypothetical protein
MGSDPHSERLTPFNTPEKSDVFTHGTFAGFPAIYHVIILPFISNKPYNKKVTLTPSLPAPLNPYHHG